MCYFSCNSLENLIEKQINLFLHFTEIGEITTNNKIENSHCVDNFSLPSFRTLL